ncbi:metallophosphoesterase [bacterium]|nr:metallophosphoesterase [bacterium]
MDLKTTLLTIVITILFILFCFIQAYFIEPEKLHINNQNLYLPYWNKQLDGLKVCVISDLHIGTRNMSLNKLNTIVEEINAKNPDIIFILGDFDAISVTYAKFAPSDISKILGKLSAPLGVISVLGNHDYNPPEVIKHILKDAKIIILEDTQVNLTHKGYRFQVHGTKDWWHFDIDIKSNLKNSNIPTIVLSHNPDIFPEVPPHVALTLSGHTHGGEVRFPLLGSPFVPSKHCNKYAKGYVIENSKHLFVTSGLATLSRFRFFNPPEIVILNLFAQNKETEIKHNIKHKFFDILSNYNLKKYYKLKSILG